MASKLKLFGYQFMVHTYMNLTNIINRKASAKIPKEIFDIIITDILILLSTSKSDNIIVSE